SSSARQRSRTPEPHQTFRDTRIDNRAGQGSGVAQPSCRLLPPPNNSKAEHVLPPNFGQSPLNTAINAIGGHILIFSNVSSVTNTVANIAGQIVENRHGWTVIGLEMQI